MARAPFDDGLFVARRCITIFFAEFSHIGRCYLFDDGMTHSQPVPHLDDHVTLQVTGFETSPLGSYPSPASVGLLSRMRAMGGDDEEIGFWIKLPARSGMISI